MTRDVPSDTLLLEGVREHNLRDVTVELPHGRLTVVTGVSGSGKSSLVFDTLHAAASRRYLETLSGHARRFLQRLPSPRMRDCRRLSPTIALSQRRGGDHPRSTVGTLSGLFDLLRFWFAAEHGMEAREFSFVTAGACPTCRGVGRQDEVSRELLVADPTKTLRQGALVPTTPNGYIVYSQVTVDVLDTVCRAHGFDVDTPWQQLSEEQQDVVFFGSDRVEVPFGKHSLESRMRWEGITAKPRELGHYKGLIPTIADILRRSRNENALRFARSVPCADCGGSRLSRRARSVRVGGRAIDEVAAMPLPRLREWARGCAGHDVVRAGLDRRLATLLRLGLGHLSCERASSSLSGGEHQRLRLATMATAGMAGVTFVFDEPSIGLHWTEEHAVLDLLCELRDDGNTVVVVEHSREALRRADHVVQVGPGAGRDGGRVLFCGPASQLPPDEPVALRERSPVDGVGWIELDGARARNLRDVDVRFAIGRVNAVAGVAGAGKSTLVGEVLVAALRAQLDGRALPDTLRALRGADVIGQVVHVDQAPIGRTPRSNPATYTGVFDDIRKAFAALPEAKRRGFTASTFSFNTKTGGRCPACEGSGREVVGMHGLPDVELVCAACGGRRFRDDVLEVRLDDRHSVLDVLEATVDEARPWFDEQPRVARVLDALQKVGLGYLSLGQPATTLSGGEAQRVKLAGELARGGRTKTLFVLEEPTIGLHRADVAQLLRALDELVRLGHTVVLVEHDLDVLRAADHVVDLGPGAGEDGGRVCGTGTAAELAELDTPTGRALRSVEHAPEIDRQAAAPPVPPIALRGVATHNLRGLDVDLPPRGLTVVTGVSGSGKSSLVFDTLHAESRQRMTEHLSSHLQRQLGSDGVGERALVSANGLRPTIALAQRTEADARGDRRSTVATAAGLHDVLRVLWSRLNDGLAADAFSWLRHEGACPACAGAGSVLRCDPDALLRDASRPLLHGALRVDNKVVAEHVDPHGRSAAVLRAVAAADGWDLDAAWQDLPIEARDAALHGCGEREFDAVWAHAGGGDDEHRWRTRWLGIAGEIEREYARRQASGAKGRAQEFAALMALADCAACDGQRLAEAGRTAEVAGRTLPQLLAQSVDAVLAGLQAGWSLDERRQQIARDGLAELQRRLARLAELGLGHLHLDRAVASLSAGERQRVRLARQLAAPLFGCTYVLDEPTVGLHPRDVQGLLDTVRGLVDAGNAVVAVEHDLAFAAAADHVVELGPGAGVHGGALVAAAPVSQLPAASRTAKRLRGAGPRAAAARVARTPNGELRVVGARRHHLQNVDVAFPTGCLDVVTGVSGSGKSSLVSGVLAATAAAGRPVYCDRVVGLDAFAEVLDDRGARAGRSRSTCVAELLGVFEALRKQFAATDEAKQRGWRAGHFAYGGKAGACPECGGLGRLHDEADLLGAGSSRVCEACHGARYRAEVLEVTWRGMNIADVLASTVGELAQHLTKSRAPKVKALTAPLQLAEQLGLGYLRLGQAGDTLSGGEAQRLHVVAHVASSSGERCLFLLDEPTRGLHPDDVDLLLDALERLVDDGHTVIAVEHDLAVIRRADHVVDLGPGAGEAGGRVVFAGAPEELAKCAESATGAALA